MNFLLSALFISLGCNLWNDTRSIFSNKTSKELNVPPPQTILDTNYL